MKDNLNMKIVVTGAHFTPAQAVIEEFKKDPEVELIFIGRKTTPLGVPTLESQNLPKLGVKFYPIIAGGLKRFISLGTITSLIKIPIGFIQSFYILSKEKPSVILSFGGYVGVPVVISAWLLSIPVILHEQTLISGLANRISSLFANKIAVSFDSKYFFKKEKIVLTGNPIRKELLSVDNKKFHIEKNVTNPEIIKIIKFAKTQKLPLVYITGGNQGSHAINLAVDECLEKLTKVTYVIHQTGDSAFKDYEMLVQKKSDKYFVKKWFDVSDLAAIYKNVDLVISRAGANTLLELAFFQLPALVVPIPYLSGDEQNKNAKFFQSKGLVEILSQEKLSAKTLLENITSMLKNIHSLKIKAKTAKELVIKDAAKRLKLETLTLVNNV